MVKTGNQRSATLKVFAIVCTSKDNKINRAVCILSLKNLQVVYMAGNPQSYSAGKRSGKKNSPKIFFQGFVAARGRVFIWFLFFHERSQILQK
jgi:hypothetical protein